MLNELRYYDTLCVLSQHFPTRQRRTQVLQVSLCADVDCFGVERMEKKEKMEFNPFRKMRGNKEEKCVVSLCSGGAVESERN